MVNNIRRGIIMKNYIYLNSIILFFCFLYLGCDSDEFTEKGTSIEKGTCKVTVKGYLNKSFSGKAVYDDIYTGKGYFLFIMRLQDIIEPGVNYHFIEFQTVSKPNIGKHNIANFENQNDSTLSGIPARYNDSDHEGTFNSKGGSLEISLSDNNTLLGKFNFPAYGYVNNKGESTKVEITVTGEFYAEEGDTGIILN